MERPPPLRLLAVFAAVARRGSMRAAAEELNVSQSAVSQSLRALEGHIGAPLFDRSSKPPKMTRAGRILEAAAAAALGRIEEAVESIRAEARADEAAVTVACTHGFATYWLMPRLSAFYAAHPDTPVNVQASPSELRAPPPGVDATFFYGASCPFPGRAIRLFDEAVQPVGRPDVVAGLVASGRSWSAASLIHVEVETSGRWASWSDYAEAVGAPPPPPQGLRFNTYVQAVQTALAGRGVMLGWRSITDDLVASGDLMSWPEGRASFGTAYHLVVSPRAEARPAVRSFAEWAGAVAVADG